MATIIIMDVICRVILEPLSDSQQQLMEEHNEAALQTFVQYVRCYVRSMSSNLENPCTLPLSGDTHACYTHQHEQRDVHAQQMHRDPETHLDSEQGMWKCD